MSVTDEVASEVLLRARVGDPVALATLVESVQNRVYSFSLKMCTQPEDAKDVLQETLLSLVRDIGKFRGDSTLSTWLYTVARSHCIKKRRRGKHAPQAVLSWEDEVDQDEVATDGAALPDESLSQKQLDEVIKAAIVRLSPPYREVFVLRDVEGLSANEVAAVVGIGVEAVKSRLHRARLSVREWVAPALDGKILPSQSPGSCPDVLTLLSKNMEGEISQQTCADMEKHLASCSRCRGACDSLRKTLFACRSTAGDEVPKSVQHSVKVALQQFFSES
ncbi:MAG: sigma-70 family RNA polymerase sigma factor [Polyangiaceae bacterium]|nr:sigma-70 family RNA polymerase sigma factor [Polyangiaceae bacterium]